MGQDITIDTLRRHAVARSLFPPTQLQRAIQRLGFVQADPIRAPARAQDLTLRHRVRDYCAGDLERRYRRLAVEEDCLVNYGFLPREHLALMHPRRARQAWDADTERLALAVRDFIEAKGSAHPRAVQEAFSHGSVRNAWGGQSNAITHLLDGMHYRGWLRVTHRDKGQRVYATVTHRPDPRSDVEKADALIDLVLQKYAPLPAPSLRLLGSHLRYGAPHLHPLIRQRLPRLQERAGHARVAGVDWFWPAEESPQSKRWRLDDQLRLLAPFDPIVWDRYRFEQFWGWPYRFEAYTPTARRQWGYYALPMLWRGQVMGWANLNVDEGVLQAECGFVELPDASRPQALHKDPAFEPALMSELSDMARFLGAAAPTFWRRT